MRPSSGGPLWVDRARNSTVRKPSKDGLLPTGTGLRGNKRRAGFAPPLASPSEADTKVGTLPMVERAILSGYGCLNKSLREATSGPLWKVKDDPARVKAVASRYRSSWIHGGTGADAQLSFVGRALPPAGKEAMKEALRVHREDFSSTFKTPPGLLRQARKFAYHFSKRYLPKFKGEVSSIDWPTSSSCLERGAGRGGLMAHVCESSICYDPPKMLEGRWDYPSMEIATRSKFLAFALDQARWDVPPQHRVTCIAERGLKTRVVSTAPAWTQVLGHSVRLRLLGALRNVPGVKEPLKGAKDEAILNTFIGACGECLVSTDLTRATDLLPHDLVSAVVEGLGDSKKLSPLEMKILRLLSGPQELHYPDKSSIVSTRGILMGLPTTWSLLSIIHLFWLDQAKRAHPRKKGELAFSICGDDALVAGSVASARVYADRVKACGGSPSAGKHFESVPDPKDQVKKVRGVFLERLFEFTLDSRGKIIRGERNAAVPLKGLSSKGVPRNFRGADIIDCRSLGLSLCISLENIVTTQGETTIPVLKDFVRRCHPWLTQFSRERLELDIGSLPLSLGGFRFSSEKPEPPREIKLADCVEEPENKPEGSVPRWVAVAASGKNFSVSLKRELDSLWKLATPTPNRALDYLSEGGVGLCQLNLLPDGNPELPDWDRPLRLISEDDLEEEFQRMNYTTMAGLGMAPRRRVFTLRSQHFRGTLRRLAKAGVKNLLSGLTPEVLDTVSKLSLSVWDLPADKRRVLAGPRSIPGVCAWNSPNGRLLLPIGNRPKPGPHRTGTCWEPVDLIRALTTRNRCHVLPPEGLGGQGSLLGVPSKSAVYSAQREAYTAVAQLYSSPPTARQGANSLQE
nr:MAG: RNA-dependent RNA polymerase [Narnaviridae sp.]